MVIFNLDPEPRSQGEAGLVDHPENVGPPLGPLEDAPRMLRAIMDHTMIGKGALRVG